MAAQTSYNYGTRPGDAGGIFDLAPHAIETFTAGEAMEGFGLPAYRIEDFNDKVFGYRGIKNVAGEGTPEFLGVTVNNRSTEHRYHAEGLDIMKGNAVGVMRYGNIWVQVDPEAEITSGAKVKVSAAGLFTNGEGTAINARFITAGVNGVAAIELQQANVIEPQQANASADNGEG